MVTPLQLLDTISSIANGGPVYTPHLFLDAPQKTLFDLSDLAPELKEVRRGMEDAVREPYGTAHLLADLPFRVAAKTGSAQTAGNTKINALFVGYAPAADPRIAVLVLIEDAREGSLNAVPIAKDVLSWYYEHRLKE
jgi:cell division protein FtsI/penicillin-binding protein 2